MKTNIIYNQGCLSGLKLLPDSCIDCCISSPPYWGLRDYEAEGQLGVEKDFKDFIGNLIEIYKQVYRVLKPTGTCFVNLGDTYSGSGNGSKDKGFADAINGQNYKDNKPIPKTGIKNKSLLMIPERFGIEMISNGWILRNQIIWHKPNQMPSSAKDRFTVDFEKIFFFVKQQKYYFKQQLEPYSKNSDMEYRVNLRKDKDYKLKKHSPYKNNLPMVGAKKPVYNPGGRNVRTVWSINTKPFSGSHFAVFPEKLVTRIIKAGCPEGGLVFDPFMGAGTTAVVARKLKRNYIGYELNKKYIDIANKRLYKELGMFL